LLRTIDGHQDIDKVFEDVAEVLRGQAQ